MDHDLTAVLAQIRVHYQPIVDLDTGAVAGFEALVRTTDANGAIGSIGPVIDAIESDPQLLELLMRQLLKNIRQEAVPLFDRYPDFYVSVNVPPAILGTRKIARMIDEFDLYPYLRRLVCEITERQALTPEGRAALEASREHRIRVALDDFGTGNSGLTQLLGLSVDILKMDRSQVVQVAKDPVHERLIRGIIALASLIRARVVAEGVDTPAQALFLQAAGVDYGQGWFWSRAVPATDLPRLIETGFPDWRRKLIDRLNNE